jgi:lipopolysaccharide export system permease protein
VFGSILSRMIFWELVKVFTLSLLAITGIMLMGGIVAEASQNGLGPFQVLGVIPLLIPSFLPYTIPATTLFATCVVFGRLSHDNEILAIKAAGVNILHVLKPGILLGLVMSVATLSMYYSFIPYTHYLLRNMFLQDVEEVLYGILNRDRAIKDPRSNYSMFVRRVEGRKLIDVIFKRRDSSGAPDFVVWAREAELHVDMDRREVLVSMRNCDAFGKGADFMFSTDHVEPVPLPAGYGSGYEPRPRDLTWPEILQKRQELREQVRAFDAELEAVAQGTLPGHKPEDLPTHGKNLAYKRAESQQKIFGLEAELQMRPAICLGCLCFVLVGCPVGIWFSRSDYLSAFITCFLPIVFLYYPLLLSGTNMAKEGRFPTVVWAWAADAVVMVIGLLLFRRLLKN